MKALESVYNEGLDLIEAFCAEFAQNERALVATTVELREALDAAERTSRSHHVAMMAVVESKQRAEKAAFVVGSDAQIAARLAQKSGQKITAETVAALRSAGKLPTNKAALSALQDAEYEVTRTMRSEDNCLSAKFAHVERIRTHIVEARAMADFHRREAEILAAQAEARKLAKQPLPNLGGSVAPADPRLVARAESAFRALRNFAKPDAVRVPTAEEVAEVEKAERDERISREMPAALAALEALGL
jgi:hypothetical protein